jgi:hypothetical protein
METLTFKPLFGTRRAIHAITKQGMTNALHMYTNLMGAAGFQYTADVRIASV